MMTGLPRSLGPVENAVAAPLTLTGLDLLAALALQQSDELAERAAHVVRVGGLDHQAALEARLVAAAHEDRDVADPAEDVAIEVEAEALLELLGRGGATERARHAVNSVFSPGPTLGAPNAAQVSPGSSDTSGVSPVPRKRGERSQRR